MKAGNQSVLSKLVIRMIVCSFVVAANTGFSLGKTDAELPNISINNHLDACLSVTYLSFLKTQSRLELTVNWREIKSIAHCSCMTASPYYWISRKRNLSDDGQALDEGKIDFEPLFDGYQFKVAIPDFELSKDEILTIKLGCMPSDK